MYSATLGRWGAAFLLGLCVLTGSARAGGPIVFNEEDGQTFPWLGNRAVYVVETGNLGAIENAQATELVTQAFQSWVDVPTADLQVQNLDGILPSEILAPFKQDIDFDAFFFSTECTVPGQGTSQLDIITCAVIICIAQGLVDCPSPMIFDEDGSITEAIFGVFSGVIGFSGPILFSTPGDPVEPFRILQAFTVLNGAFFDGDQPGEDREGTLFLEALMVHEFGHFLGLGHSDVNGDIALLNPAVEEVGTTGIGQRAILGPVDALAAVRADDVETMYPILIREADGFSPQNDLERDDKVALSTLYPNEAALSTTGTISGNVFIPCTTEEGAPGQCITGSIPTPDGGRANRAQGVLVIARRIDENSPDDVLKEAASQFTGNTFAPLRCTDPFGLGFLFGECSTPSFFIEDSEEECGQTLSNFGLPTTCGFFSLGLSNPPPSWR